MLARPYDSEVPFGASGDVTWATSPQGWAFRDGVHLLYISERDGVGIFDLIVRWGAAYNYIVDKAEYTPSHVHMTGAPGSLLHGDRFLYLRHGQAGKPAFPTVHAGKALDVLEQRASGRYVYGGFRQTPARCGAAISISSPMSLRAAGAPRRRASG